MGYDTWKTTDFEHERKCAIEEADEKNRRDAAADLFDQFALGDEVAIDEVMDMLDDTGRWQDVIESLRAAYYRPGESHADKALRVLLAYESAMDDVCLRIVEGPAHMGEPVLPPKAQGVPEGFALAPKSMCITQEDVGLIVMMTGWGGEDQSDAEGILWFGPIEDDDGKRTHGLNISCSECMEEGAVQLVQFDEPDVTPPVDFNHDQWKPLPATSDMGGSDESA